MLTINSLSMGYGKKVAIEDISFSVSPGEVMALIGPNGAGKTTLIRGISGILDCIKGSITYEGVDLLKLAPIDRARILAVVPQSRALGGAFTVEQTVMMGRTAHMNWLGKPGEGDEEIVWASLEKTNTTGLADRRIAELSGGEQQRVLLARALAQDTPLLLLDEPTNHLDLKHRSTILSLVAKLAKENNLAVLMAIHDLNLVSIYSERVVLLVDGKVKALGKSEDVLTTELISDAYQTQIKVISHPDYRVPIILPDQELD
ncbi:MAG: ABC transporter ATP-binding protein [Chloroflexi bacterium]|nr:ABC transporter ATP-binding protein [Chloroflexota bacterium]MBT3670381.1 ABC transporter ATP-binding protein [Chloroflexota bacterium]MBT4002044.1 ABC transporter ATP-binding protein [Chloroflexota bacterium]MBT4305568.1 ABC transporter ATP-binding protein [Chloroflexota bacterium]MBT4682038.1 ABC transporter ATP-binding protein [Chloroflexota bacterium]